MATARTTRSSTSAAAAGPDFEVYLQRFIIVDRKKEKPDICYEKKPDAANAKGNEALTEELHNQKQRHLEKIEKENRTAEEELHNELRRGVDPDVKTFMKLICDFMKKHEKRNRDKSDIESSSSTWNFKRFNKYIPKLKIEFKEPHCHHLQQEETNTWFYIMFCSIQQKYLELAAVYMGAQVRQTLELGQCVAFLKELQNCDYREATTRVFVDALITPLLLRYNMQVRLEERLYETTKERNLPNCIADYVIYSREGEILGAIETKAGGYLKAESVIQCMLQLLALRKKAPHALFGVLTDAVRYVFIVLKMDGTFWFERNPEKPTHVSYTFNTWEDLWRIFRVFKLLLQSSQQRLSKQQNIGQKLKSSSKTQTSKRGSGDGGKFTDNSATPAKRSKQP